MEDVERRPRRGAYEVFQLEWRAEPPLECRTTGRLRRCEAARVVTWKDVAAATAAAAASSSSAAASAAARRGRVQGRGGGDAASAG